MVRFRLRAAVLAFLVLFSGLAGAAEKKVAMVVGNSAYDAAGTLPNTLNDARAVAAALERLGFLVLTAYDASQAALLETLDDFSSALKGSDAAVFFYAGHGMQMGTENYILPVDIRVESELSVRYGALSLSDVLREVETLSKVAIVILDACRDNPFAAQLAAADPSRSLSVSRGLARVGPLGNGTIIAYAAAPGEVASDGSGEHSPYTAALIAEMEKPGVEVGLLFRRVAGRVIEETAGRQRPELLVRLASEYYLADVAPAPVAAAPVQMRPQTPEPAPVDVAASGIDTRPGAPGLRQATEEPNAGRATLWGYASSVLMSPFDAPSAAWTVPPRGEVAELEPNNSFGTAQLVGANDAVTLAISPAGDTDWVRLAVQRGGKLTVHAPTPPEAIDLATRLVNANGDEVAYWVQARRPGGELLAEFDIARPGVYWLQFADANSDQAAARTFAVNLTYEAQPDLFEPDDRIDLAKHVPLDGSFPINILPRGDRDWFKFTTMVPGALVVSLTDVPETIDGAFRLLNADGIEVAYWTVAPRPGGDTIAVLDLPRPGVYYIEVADSNSDAGAIAPLTLTTRFAPSPDLFEPNDSIGQAMRVAESGKQSLAIFPKGDTDWLELEIVQPGELTLEIKAPPENLDLGYRVVDASGVEAQYWTVAPRPGGDLSGAFDVARPGRYFLQLADSNNDASSIEPFELDLKFTASLDAYEPNDGIGSARVLTPGGEVPFTILPRGDADWFRVTVGQPGELAVSIDAGPQELDIAYRVINSDWSELAYWVPPYRKGGLTEGFVDLALPGTYFIEIRDGNNDGRSIEPATLKTAFTPTLGGNEPNNFFGEATPVEISGETQAHILPRGDADWHVFYAPSAGELDVEIEEVADNLDIAFRLLDAERNEIQYWINAPRPGGVTTGTVAIPAPGWYWMELRDGSSDERSTQPFWVNRVFRPAS